MTYSRLFSALLLLAIPGCSNAAACPPDGPLLPRPTTLHTSPAIKNSTETLTSILNKAVSGDLKVPWAVSNVSFSVAVVSLDTPDPTAPLWEYHHLATGNTNGTKNVDGDSQYLIGSISKVFTDLLLLKTGLNLDDPITKFLPELKSEDSPIRWDEISLSSLGDHLSGMPPTFGFPEIFYLIQYYEALGFPKLPQSAWPNCGVIGLNPGCTKQQLLENLKTSHPVSAPNLRPVYSSLSFTLLSYAMQVATGKNYSQLLQDEVLTPLNLTNTGLSPGDDAKAVIPPLEGNTWGADYGDNAPGGGLYSSTHDLSSLLISLISPDPNFLSRSQVNKWLKPHSITTSLNTLVGLPWEIYRTQNLTPAYPHIIDLYTKGGAAQGYEAVLGVIEQYGLGFVVLTAGAKGVEAQVGLEVALLKVLMPVVEEVARDEARVYTGAYKTGNGSDIEGIMRVGIDDGPGLRLMELKRNGSDIVEAIRTLWEAQPVNIGKLSDQMRLYPTDVVKEVEVYRNKRSGGKKFLVEEDWRLQYDIFFEKPESELPFWEEQEQQCIGWQSNDAIVYGGESVDRFVFVRDGHGGRIVEVRVPSLRLNLTVHN